MLSPSAYYQQKQNEYRTEIDKLVKNSNSVAMLRLVCALAGIAMAIWAYNGGCSWWCVAAVAMAFILLVRYANILTDRKTLLQLKVTIMGNELKALAGDNSAFADGAEYINVAHPYSYDLDIFGKGSVYQMLCRSATRSGALQLADRLSTLIQSKTAIAEKQEIIKELSTMPDLQQDFRVAGAVGQEGETDQQRLANWLQDTDHFIDSTITRVLGFLLPALSVSFIVYSIAMGEALPIAGLLIVINWVILAIYQKRIKPAIAQIGNSEAFIDKFERLLQQLAAHDFKNNWLQAGSQEARQSLKGIKQFKALLRLFDTRESGFIGPMLNSLFLFDIYCLLRLELWRKKYKTVLLGAMDVVVDIDVYVSCAVYAFNHPDNIYPELTESGNTIQAKDLRHPLLPPTIAIGNDLVIGDKEQFYLLTGANMTGKSTFIRTVGITTVLCNVGVPLPAKELSMPVIDLYTSMRITDSVQDDVSYFRAELNRIKAIMDKVRTADRPYLILLDEPLRGTNSTDKQQGTRSIVETLLTFHAIGIVATHDTGLGDMATNYKEKVSNYHFESKVETSGLSFDFKLKHGVSTSNNATILMKQMGIIN